MSFRPPPMPFRPPRIKELPEPSDVGFPAAAEAYVLRIWSFYDSRARWHRRFYRLTGILVIFVGAALPMLSSLDYAHKEVAVSVAGIIVAVVTGLRAFYRWDQSWVLLRNTEIVLSNAYWAWKGSAAETTEAADERQRAARNEAAIALVAKVTNIRQGEAESFFKDLTYPQPGVAG
ncbi:MAG TPA: DUF4231 domain-containing protein [Streptosporangiaceae bacterium]|nr:DUF4231 domain-containing protein [Streptosporangiaceae bacterium]